MLGLTTMLGVALAAQAPLPGGGDVICVTSARIWAGSLAETRRIREVPVPESFRRPFKAGGCTRFQLVVSSLIDWHLAFGDETTTAAALAYIQADHQAGIPAPDDYGAALAVAWRRAERDLRAAAILVAEPRQEWDAFQAAFQRSRPIRRLRALTYDHRLYLYLAGEYLRAAEFYDSPALLERARLYFVPVEAGERIFGAPGADGYPTEEIRHALSLNDDSGAKSRDLEERLAILRARLSRATADIDAAATVMDGHFSPLLRRAAENAYEHGDDFCYVGDRTDLGDIQAACSEDGNFASRVTAFWVNQAHLDLLMAADPAHYSVQSRYVPSSGSGFVRHDAGTLGEGAPAWSQLRSFYDAMRLLQRGRIETIPEGSARYDRTDDALVALRIAHANMLARLSPLRRGAGDGQAPYEADGFEISALHDLRLAGRLATPAEMPGRFRQIASLFLSIDAGIRARPPGRPGYAYDPRLARHAAYMREALDALDRIIVAEPADQLLSPASATPCR